MLFRSPESSAAVLEGVRSIMRMSADPLSKLSAEETARFSFDANPSAFVVERVVLRSGVSGGRLAGFPVESSSPVRVITMLAGRAGAVPNVPMTGDLRVSGVAGGMLL